VRLHYYYCTILNWSMRVITRNWPGTAVGNQKLALQDVKFLGLKCRL